MNGEPLLFICKDNGRYPGSRLPVVLYKEGLSLPLFLKTLYIKRVFATHHWNPLWVGGVAMDTHYHSTAHIALGVIGGSTTIQLGGDNGQKIRLSKGDVLIIPAGAAYRNLGMETQVQCVLACPIGQVPDRYRGEPGERPSADAHIASLGLPEQDPLFGSLDGIMALWMPAPYVTYPIKSLS
jgi:uncharacterized protein YjlB